MTMKSLKEELNIQDLILQTISQTPINKAVIVMVTGHMWPVWQLDMSMELPRKPGYIVYVF